MRELKAKGVERFNLVLTGWPRLATTVSIRMRSSGARGGRLEGMKRLADTCKELGYTFTLHDQYRDYYVDAPSYNRNSRRTRRPWPAAHDLSGTRFGSFKEGPLSFLTAWDGGKQTYISPHFMLSHLKKNYAALFAHGIHPDGSYLDVLATCPDEDFNPEHPTTRTDAKRAMANCYIWARELGDRRHRSGCDWTVPYTDYSSPLGPGKRGYLFSVQSRLSRRCDDPYSTGGEAR